MPLGIEHDQSVCHLKNCVRRTVVVFEANDFGFRPVVLEVQDVADLSTAPAVDGLIVVPYDAEIAVVDSQGLDDSILRAIGVLIFVHENVIVAR